MKIIQIIHGMYPEQVGGTELVAYYLKREWKKLGHEAYRVGGTGQKLLGLSSLKVDIGLWQKIPKDGDVYISHGIGYHSMITALWCRLNRKRSAVVVHGVPEYRGWKKVALWIHRNTFVRLMLALADVRISVAENTLKLLPHENIAVISNGVDTELFCPNTLQRLNSPQKQRSGIIYIGRKTSFKGFEMMDRLRWPVRYVTDVKHEDLPNIYNTAELVILPSKYEASPLVCFEAIATETPILCSDVGDCKKIMEEHFGFVQSKMFIFSKDADTETIDGKIAILLKNQNQLKPLMFEARKRVRDWSRVAKEYLEVIAV